MVCSVGQLPVRLQGQGGPPGGLPHFLVRIHRRRGQRGEQMENFSIFECEATPNITIAVSKNTEIGVVATVDNCFGMEHSECKNFATE